MWKGSSVRKNRSYTLRYVIINSGCEIETSTLRSQKSNSESTTKKCFSISSLVQLMMWEQNQNKTEEQYNLWSLSELSKNCQPTDYEEECIKWELRLLMNCFYYCLALLADSLVEFGLLWFKVKMVFCVTLWDLCPELQMPWASYLSSYNMSYKAKGFLNKSHTFTDSQIQYQYSILLCMNKHQLTLVWALWDWFPCWHSSSPADHSSCPLPACCQHKNTESCSCLPSAPEDSRGQIHLTFA